MTGWILVLVLGTGGNSAAIHIPDFSSLHTCQQKAKELWVDLKETPHQFRCYYIDPKRAK